MKALSVRALLSLLLLISLVPAAAAHDVTLTGTHAFKTLDGSSHDHDGSANGVFTVSDGNLVVDGVVNCNDDGPGGNSACAMAFVVSGDLTINGGGALYAENRNGAGSGAPITLSVGGNLALNGNAIVSSASKSNSTNANGGTITATVGGSVSIAAASTIDAGTPGGLAGDIAISAGGVVTVDGNILSGPSRSLTSTRLSGIALSGANGSQRGGHIAIASTTFVEPAIVIGATSNIVAQGETATGSITLDGCGIDVRGLVASISRDSASAVTIRSGKSVTVDGRDLGASGARMGRVRADSSLGTAASKRVDIYAADAISISGPAVNLFAVTSNTGSNDPKGEGGTVRVIALAGTASASGRAIAAGGSAVGNGGGTIDVAAAGDALLNGAILSAAGDSSSKNSHRDGGVINVRSFAGNVFWTNGAGDVRPLGSASSLPTADQGSIALTACGTVDTTGSTFPVNGVATSIHPTIQTGVCAPSAPSLPIGVPPLVTCNTPPVADDVAATTNEDTAVTITLSGTDADGDPLTFTIVSGPAHGTLGTIVSTGPTTATVLYTPALNDNGTDSFVYRANDGNGGTDDATVTITIAPVNDAPSFLAGPTVNVLEDSGPQTYANWVTSISAGPADEAAQTVTFTVTNDNNALFSVQPSVSSNGTLTFTPAANAYGSATITVVAQDDGGTANGGVDTSAPQSSAISVTAVNDEPSFAAGASQTVSEDAGPQTVTGWATAISAGPNESQNLTFVLSASNPSLFAAGPSVAPDGTLTYTPAADANGTATISIHLMDDGGTANGGDDTSPVQSFSITITAVNDAPSFTSGGDVTVNEDSGAWSAAWATNISAGPADEAGQSLTFSVTNSNAALFSLQPAIDATGNLTFTPEANAFGSATVTVTLSDDGGTANGGVDTSAPQSFTITVNAVNDEPSFTAGGNVTVNEDSGSYTAAWASSISAGPGETQTLTFVVSNDDNALFAAQPAIDPAGVLTFTPASNAFGSATVTVHLMDDGGTANGGDDTSASVTFTIDLAAVNDEPSFTGGGSVTVNEDGGPYSAVWATAVTAGPANESSQTVAFFVSNDNNALFAAQPVIDASGVLTFTPAANAFGVATVSVYVQDDGGTASGGDDTSATQTFTITVNAVNDAPSFTAGGSVTVNEDSGAYSAAWASAISAGPGEAGQVVAFVTSNDNNALFSAQPVISAAGVLSFTPALNAFGTATVSVYAQDDGGTANGGIDTSATVTFTITVNGINDPPTAGIDTWDTFGNTELRVVVGAVATPHVSDTTTSTKGVLDNDADAVEGDPFAITAVVGCGDTTAPFDCVVTGGFVSLNANGSFSFKPSPGATTASFQYVVTDMPSAGAPASATGTVTITLHEMIWYVNGAAPVAGNGTSSAPFNSFASLNGVGDVDDTNDYIFVHSSTVNDSIALEQGQRLLGEGVGLVLPNDLNGNGAPAVLVPAGVRAKIYTTGDSVSVPGVTAEIAGLELNSSTGSAIDVTSTFLSAASTVSIHDNVIAGAAAEGIDVNAGSASGTTVLVSGTSIVSTGHAFDYTATLGTNVVSFTNGTVGSLGGSGIRIEGVAPAIVKISGLANVTVTGNTLGDGIRVTNASFDANPATAGFDVVNAGAVSVGSSGDPVGGQAIALMTASGDLAFASLSAHGSTGVAVAGTGLFSGAAGMRVTSGGGVIRGIAGTALSIANASIGAANFNATRIDATGGTNGIVLNNTGSEGGLTVSGTGPAGSGGTLSGASGDGILLTSTTNVSLSSMNVTGNLGSGIRGATVHGFVLDGCTITSNGDSAITDDSGVNLSELTGTGSAGTHPTVISNSTISNNYEFEIQIANSAGTLPDLQLNACTVSSNGASGVHGNLVTVLASGTAAVALKVSGGSFTGAAPATATAIHADASGGSITVDVGGATFTNNNVGVSVSTALGGSAVFDVHDNPAITGNRSSALNLFIAANATGSVSGKFRNNVIGTAGVAGSGSLLGFGVRVQNEALVNADVLISGNTIQELANFAAVNVNHGIAGSPLNGQTSVTVSNNVIRNVANNRAIIVQQNVGKGTTCASISGNDMAGVAGVAGDGSKIRIRQLAGGTFNVAQKQATAAADPVELDDANSVGANITTAAQISASGTFNYNAGACPQP